VGVTPGRSDGAQRSPGRAAAAPLAALVDWTARVLEAASLQDAREAAEAIVGASLAEAPADDAPSLFLAVARRARRRVMGEPLAYVVGRQDFRGLPIKVDARVMVPRSDALVDAGHAAPSGGRVLDLGTGSGAIALALARARPDLRITASDISPDAIVVARANAQRLGLPVSLVVADGFPAEHGPFDLVLANLPYLAPGRARRLPGARFEPVLATAVGLGEDPLGVIRRVLATAPARQPIAIQHPRAAGAAIRGMLHRPRTAEHASGPAVTTGAVRG
jgi:release factor glutamine methyltransferase